MFAAALILFRETLEAALLVGILAAATRGLAQRTRWLTAGVLVGAAGSLLMAAGMERISAWADGIGQDLLNAVILSIALAMLAWHCIWVSAHTREMIKSAKDLGARAMDGSGTLWALALAVAMAVLREGAESVLFVAGVMSSTQEGLPALLTGVVAGLLAGMATGVLIYSGLARVRTQHLFSVTNVLILILAGSLASQLAKALSQSGLITLGSAPAWDGSALLPDSSSVAVVLHALVGYEASPSVLQLIFYVGTIVLIWAAAKKMQAAARHKYSRPATI